MYKDTFCIRGGSTVSGIDLESTEINPSFDAALISFVRRLLMAKGIVLLRAEDTIFAKRGDILSTHVSIRDSIISLILEAISPGNSAFSLNPLSSPAPFTVILDLVCACTLRKLDSSLEFSSSSGGNRSSRRNRSPAFFAPIPSGEAFVFAGDPPSLSPRNTPKPLYIIISARSLNSHETSGTTASLIIIIGFFTRVIARITTPAPTPISAVTPVSRSSRARVLASPCSFSPFSPMEWNPSRIALSVNVVSSFFRRGEMSSLAPCFTNPCNSRCSSTLNSANSTGP
mmetsp:Transcript_32222/g.51896  ORF Transcript_32222/g.51896 Transcript_32222/m.51896 type:complete len:286 (-) Transcript_32222:629-1486(-)